MKKIILIAGLLLVVSNVLADNPNQFNERGDQGLWNKFSEIEGAFAWFSQSSEKRIIVFLPDDDDLAVCDYKRARKYNQKAYFEQNNEFFKKNISTTEKEIYGEKNDRFFHVWNHVSSQLGISEFKKARKLFDKEAKRATTFKELLDKLKSDFTSSGEYSINSVQIRVLVSLDTDPIKLDFQGCVLVVENKILLNPPPPEYSWEPQTGPASNFTVGTLEMPLTENGLALYRKRITSALNQQMSERNLIKELNNRGGLETLVDNTETDFWKAVEGLTSYRIRDTHSDSVTITRDPFESEAEYEERLSKLEPDMPYSEKKQYGLFRIDLPLALKSDVEGSSGLTFITTYNVETESFNTYIKNFKFGRSRGKEKISTYSAKNAFGSYRTITKRVWEEGYFQGALPSPSEEPHYSFHIPRDQAKQMVNDLSYIVLLSYDKSRNNLNIDTDRSYADYYNTREEVHTTNSIGANIASIILYNKATKKIIAHKTNLESLFPSINRKNLRAANYKVKGTHLSDLASSGFDKTTTLIPIGRRNLCYLDALGVDSGEIVGKSREAVTFFNYKVSDEIDGMRSLGRRSGIYYRPSLENYRERCMQNLFIDDIFIIKEGGVVDSRWVVGHF